MSLQNFNPSAPIDLEKLVEILLPYIYEAVRRACLQYKGHICQDELDDLSQQVTLELIEENCRRLRSFNHDFSFKTWLKAVVNHHVSKYFYRRKQTESLDEVDQGSLIYSPPQYRDIYTAEKQILLLRALGKLSEEERLLYQLWFVSEIDAAKIAAVFGTEIKIIYKRKQTLVHKLTKLVQTFRN